MSILETYYERNPISNEFAECQEAKNAGGQGRKLQTSISFPRVFGSALKRRRAELFAEIRCHVE